MKTMRFILTATGVAAVTASVLCVWQHHRLAQSRTEVERLRTEAVQLPVLQSELARRRQVAVEHAELARLRQQQNADQLELLRLRAKAASGRRAESEATEPEPQDPAEAQERVLHRKLQALEGVLTPAQLAGYRQQQEMQLAFLQRMVSRVEPPPTQP